MDFLGLESDKTFDNVPIEHLDYGYVEKCGNAKELLAILKVLQSGKEGRYHELEAFVERRMMEVMSPADKSKYIALTQEPSRQDMDDASSDVASFLASVKPADAELAAAAPGAGRAPPPRGATSAAIAASTAPQPIGQGGGSQPQRVDWKSGDLGNFYDKWGKFDADAELSKLEGAAAAPGLTPEERAAAEAKRQATLAKLKMPDPAGMTAAARSTAAGNEKVKGNDAYRAKEYSEAAVFYSRSLQYVPGAPVVLSNRAMAYIKTSAWAEAEADCDLAIAADATLVKAWVRRGTARSKRGNFAGAMGDLAQAALLAPERPDVAKLLSQAKAKFGEVEGSEAKAALAELGVQGVLKAMAAGRTFGGIKSAPAPAPVPPAAYRRVAIDDDSDDSDEDEAGGARESKASAPAPAPAPAPTVAATGFTRVAIEEVDSDDSEEEEAPPAPAPAPTGPPAAWGEAEAHKARGNAAFSAKDFPASLAAYGASLASLPEQPAVHSNRALVRIKTGDLPGALQDTEAGLALVRYTPGCSASALSMPAAVAAAAAGAGKPPPAALPLTVKLLFRRGLALKAQGRLRAALDAQAEAVRLEPVNARAHGEIKDISEKLRAAAAAASPVRPPAAAPGPADTPLPPSPPASVASGTSTPGLVEVGGSASAPPTPPKAASSPASPAAEGGPSVASPGPTAAEQAVADVAKRVVASRVAAGGGLPAPAKTMYELEAAVESLGGQPQVLGKYLLTLVPRSLKKSLRRAPELDTLTPILTTMATVMCETRPKFCVNLTKALAEAPGFSTTAIMLSEEDKAAARVIVAAGKEAGSKQAALDRVTSAYGL